MLHISFSGEWLWKVQRAPHISSRRKPTGFQELFVVCMYLFTGWDMYVRDQRWLFSPPGWSHPVMCVHFHSEVRYKHFWGRASRNVKHWAISCEVHIIWQFSYSYWNCNVFIMQLYCSYNAGHVKQGLKCKHCRVNIHHICGAKVRHFSILLDPFLRWVSACQRKRRICWNGMGRSRPKVGGGKRSFQRRTGYREECAYVPAC